MRSLSPALALTGLLLTACTSAGPSGPVELGPPDRPAAVGAAPARVSPEPFRRLEGVSTTDDLDLEDGFATWKAEVPGIQNVSVRSTLDRTQQPALWLPPRGRDRPLLVVLHSWSTRYVQHQSVPYGRFAAREGWAMIAPDARGAFDRPESGGSDLALQDVLDAVAAASSQPGVDRRRVLVTGFSGGGMSALLLAGRHPERFAGVVAWVPVHDLPDWHAYNSAKETDYDDEIEALCGGDPQTDPAARQECLRRSPVTHLEGAREAGLPVYVGGGLSDRTVPPDAAVRAFDQLARPMDRLGPTVVRAAREGELPEGLRSSGRSFFTDADPDVLLTRSSGAATLVLFDGEHEIVYNPGLAFLASLPRRG